MPKADSVVCPNICLGSIITIIILFMTPTVFIPAGEYGKYDRHSCQVERIIYPTELPTPGNTTGWAECDCGKRCVTWSPCITIYTNVSSEVFAREEFYNTGGQCTFHDDECPDGEDITRLRQELIDALAIADQYENQTIDCYYDDDVRYIFLEKEWDWNTTIWFLVFIGLLTLIMICMNLMVCCEKRRERREKEKSTIAV